MGADEIQKGIEDEIREQIQAGLEQLHATAEQLYWRAVYDAEHARKRALDQDLDLASDELARGQPEDRLTQEFSQGFVAAQDTIAGGLTSTIETARRFASPHAYTDPIPVVAIFDKPCLLRANPSLEPVVYSYQWFWDHPDVAYRIQSLKGPQFDRVYEQQAKEEFEHQKREGGHWKYIPDPSKEREAWKAPGVSPVKVWVEGPEFSKWEDYRLDQLCRSAVLYPDEAEYVVMANQLAIPPECVKELRVYVSPETAKEWRAVHIAWEDFEKVQQETGHYVQWLGGWGEDYDKDPKTSMTAWVAMRWAAQVKQARLFNPYPVKVFVTTDILNLGIKESAQSVFIGEI